MAKVIRNPIVQGISGGVGRLVFRQMPDGSTYVSGKPNFSRRKFSKGQTDHQSRFQRAIAYGREASKTQPIYAKLAEGTVLSAYNIALSDWFKPPVIHTIEKKDGRILVQASDNVMVVKVAVTIVDEAGNALETGDAVKVDNDWWESASSREGKIVAEAWDLAGNCTRKAEK